MKRLIATVAVLSLALTACSGPSDEATEQEPREGQAQECPPLGDDHDPEASFTWMYSVDNTSFDPDRITTNNSLMYLLPIYDTLIYMNPEGEPEPLLAQDWEVSEDGSKLTLQLVEDYSFHDGEPFNAEAVVANIERSMEDWSFNANLLENVESAEAVDESTVVIETDAAAASVVGILGSSPGMMMSPAVMDDDDQGLKPTGGSGPFELSSYTSGSSAEYTAVEDYWDEDSQNVAEMVFNISGDDNARLNAVTTGYADVTFLRASMYEAAVESGLVVCEAPSLSAYTMNLNTERSEFGSKEVRQAINYAIDRDAISSVTDGFLEPGVQMFPDWYFAASDNLPADSTYAHDPEQARELLEQAGLADGFSFELQVMNLDLYQQIAEVIQANLAEVGIEISIVPTEIGPLSENFSVNKTADAILFEQKSESDPSTNAAEYLTPDGYNNPGGWGTDEVTSLVDESMVGETTDMRAESFTEMMDVAHDEAAPMVTLGHLTTPFVMNERARGVQIYSDAVRNFRGVGMAAE